MFNKNLFVLITGIFLLIAINIFYINSSISQNQNIRDNVILEEVQSVSAFFKSFRKTYQDIFVEQHIKLTEENIQFLPVRTSNKLSQNLSDFLNAKIILRTVSDKPRNKINQANEKEISVMKEFLDKPEKEYILNHNNYIYKYYEPLYITKNCLKCHGSKEEAPKIIKENYKEAYNYELGDLRGIISFEIDKHSLMSVLEKENQVSIFYITANIIILTTIIAFLYYKMYRNNQKNEKVLTLKNNYLERKYIEFSQFLEAVGQSEILSKTDSKGIITYVNDKFSEISGYSKEELIGQSHNVLRHPDVDDKVYKLMWSTITHKKVYRGILKNKRKDGTSYHVDCTIVPILNENSEIKEYIAMRHYVEDMMNHTSMLLDILKSSKNLVLMLVKLDRYEELEEFYTKNITDIIENKFMSKSLAFLPPNSGFRRTFMLGNGEFAFIQEVKSEDKDFLEKLQSTIAEFQENVKKTKFIVEGYKYDPEVIVSYVIGSENLYEDAKLGLKYLVKNRLSLVEAKDFLNQSRKASQKNIDVINMIKEALENKKVVSYLQPIINNRTNKIDKYESLVRIIDNKNNVIVPFTFLEVSKKGGYYDLITRVVIDNVFNFLNTMDEKISINFSYLDIANNETLEYFYEKLENCKKCKNLIVELLEDERVKDFKGLEDFIFKVKSSGVQIAIDDFGEGYSNFSRLLRFHPDIIKIDGSLIKNINQNAHNRNVVETIVAFARKEKIKTVAEFVHSKEVLDVVNEIGIDFSQGFYLGEPRAV
ncbi:EAL domain-containing protein [Sulfurimonas lithotrophica]|uniref:EAL domain-containing protein n=1 Tax=Sulfurimonas lithotrophica TaxID=2590022 RepID=A0A5P8NYT5_9BACT|nr:EAL domain-containing protein [Sulfurimonas lithotrophica]QFR48576.1 EAL domain-containing protein [Sulfurimonas lithotrophica]